MKHENEKNPSGCSHFNVHPEDRNIFKITNVFIKQGSFMFENQCYEPTEEELRAMEQGFTVKINVDNKSYVSIKDNEADLIKVLKGLYTKKQTYKPANKANNIEADDNKIELLNPPGHLYLNIGRFLFNKTTNNLVIEPIIEDMRHEYYESLNGCNETAKTKWIKINYFFAFIQVVLMKIPVTGINKILTLFSSAK